MLFEPNSKHFCSVIQPIGNLHIRAARLQTAARMIVGNNNAGCTIGNSVGENFARMNQAAGKRADGDDAFGDQSVGAVEC